MSRSPERGAPILSSAVEVFAQRGYGRTGVPHLLAATALDRPTFEARFADKEGCFLAAYDRIVAVAHAGLSATLANARQASWPARLAVGLRALLELTDANTAAARLVLVESQFAGEAALRRSIATTQSLAPFMREGRHFPTASEDLPPIIDTALPAGAAFAIRHQLLRGAHAGDLYPEMLHLLLLPYLGESETAACLARSAAPVVH